ncbi:hypothetical protein [Streptomyces huasconensis]|uniref:hypothetical protein n=1 Tax=Streptomyces huasconensis TaxID=1854574 RepID=UPI003700940D
MSHRTYISHARVAACLRQKPGVWQFVGEYRNASSAARTASLIRTASQATGSNYAPAGAFESRTRLTDDGTVIDARYVGEEHGKFRARPQADVERVLGQIERGEIRAGRDAAREIAAKAEAAYGAAWATDRAWADALTSLTDTTAKDCRS